jgi:hypothetical protein
MFSWLNCDGTNLCFVIGCFCSRNKATIGVTDMYTRKATCRLFHYDMVVSCLEVVIEGEAKWVML